MESEEQAKSRIVGRPTNESLNRQGTGDLHGRRSTKQVRFKIPLRYKKKSLPDEEKGGVEEKDYAGWDTSKVSSTFLPRELLEIVSTKWLPDDEGREIVILTVKDGHAASAPVQCESRWRHIQSEDMSFGQFFNQVSRVPGLQDDDLALVARLLNKVQRTREKRWVHGRYLKPLTLVYDGEDPDQGSKVQKTATFVSLPIFTTECPRQYESRQDFEGHPVRALLQSHYRLQSTKKREKQQVITKTGYRDENNHVIHVPQIWALVVNKHTIITCAPLDTNALRGDTIKLIPYSKALLDEATWSIQFVDPQDRVSNLPLRYCRTWFGLVKHISDDILRDEYSLVQDQLLQGGPSYRLFTKDGEQINAESWPKMVEEKRTEVIQVRLIQGSLVTYLDPNGNEIDYRSDLSSETSSIFSADDTESDESDASAHDDDVTSLYVAPAVKRLRSLQAKLKKASAEGDSARADHIKHRKIPALEEEILQLTSDSLKATTMDEEGSPLSERRDFVSDAGQGRPWRGRSHAFLDSPPISPISRPTSTTRELGHRSRRTPYSHSEYDLPSTQHSYVERTRRPHLHFDHTDGRSRSLSRPQHVWANEYDIASGVVPRSRPQSHTLDRPQMPRRGSHLQSSTARWDRVRSKMLTGKALTQQNVDEQSRTREDEIFYRPSDKQLARSRWDFLRSQVLAHAIPVPKDDSKKQIFGGEMLASTKPSKLKTAFQPLAEDHDSPVSPVSPKTTARRPGIDDLEAKAVAGLAKRSHGVKPRLKRLVGLAHQNLGNRRNEEASPIPDEGTRPEPAIKTQEDTPIFLWPTNVQATDVNNVMFKADTTSNIHQQASSPGANQVVTAVNMEEVILHTVTKEIHAYLKKPKKNLAQYGHFYERTPSKARHEVLEILENAEEESSTPALSPNDDDNDDAAILREQFLQAKSTIFSSASDILYAFVPSDFDAPVIARYWGSLYKLLKEKDESVLKYVSDRLDELDGLTKNIQNGVRAENGNKQARYQIPTALPRAFQHIVLCLVTISSISNWSEYSWRQMGATFDECETLLIEGRKQLILMIHTDDYRETTSFQAVDAEALLSLILANLIDNLSTDTEFHLTDVYSEYMSKMQTVVRDQASVKVYDDIKLLGEEIDVIKTTLRQQDDTLRDFRSTVKVTYGVASLSITVIDRMIESVEQRMDDFDELKRQAETANYLAKQSISLKAESNNKAIIVFTVVTIIFLPLSFVTSYLGMNTSDLRAMKSGQSLFWAIGTPVAFVTFSVALFAAFYGTLTQRLTGRAWRQKEKAE